MGYLYVEQKICPITGKCFDKVEYDTLACAHCRAVVRVVIKGVTKAYETPFKCEHCKRPLCKFCGTIRKGECNPEHDHIERSVKEGRWAKRQNYRYKNYVFGR